MSYDYLYILKNCPTEEIDFILDVYQKFMSQLGITFNDEQQIACLTIIAEKISKSSIMSCNPTAWMYVFRILGRKYGSINNVNEAILSIANELRKPKVDIPVEIIDFDGSIKITI